MLWPVVIVGLIVLVPVAFVFGVLVGAAWPSGLGEIDEREVAAVESGWASPAVEQARRMR